MRSMIIHEYGNRLEYIYEGEEHFVTEDPETIAMATFIADDIIAEDCDEYPDFSEMEVGNIILIDCLEQFRTLAKNSTAIINELR
jgi:hypothetical protein